MAGKKRTGKRRFFRKGPKGPKGSAQPQAPKSAMRVREVTGRGIWQLVHPPCAVERQDDLDEVQQMLEAGEFDVARDELRWLLDGCGDLVRAHQMLGEMAADEGDFALARGHFGYAFDICRAAFPEGRLPGPLPYELPENQALHESAKGLAWCLRELGKQDAALRVLEEMTRWDPTDPLGAKALAGSWITTVELQLPPPPKTATE